MAERRHWRSFDELADTPAFREARDREFPEGAHEPPTGLSRRQMLGLMGASASLAGLAACRRPVEKIVPYVDAPENVVPGIPRRYATTMPFGGTAYGLLVESREGRPTKIEGNPDHPTTAGRSNVFMQAETLRMYDPDRSPSPTHDGAASDWESFLSALAPIRERWAATGGDGAAIVCAPFDSPTLKRLQRELQAAYPALTWVTWEPLHDARVREGARLATGVAARPRVDLTSADVILSLDADLLGTDPESVRHARAFADGRRVTPDSDRMNRLYAVEAAFSTTGATADHRMPLASAQMPAFLSTLVDELRRAGVSLGGSIGGTQGIDREWVRALAGDLASHRGRSLVVAGPRQPAEVHAAAFAINRALGNVGATIDFHARPHAADADPAALESLIASMEAGAVQELIVIEANPAYDAPGFARAMDRVGTTVHFGYERDETAAHAAWHANASHFLESWGDACASDGTLSVIQPLIEPLYESRSTVGMLALLLDGEAAPAYDQVRRTWSGVLSGNFDAAWNRVLHDGVFPASAPSLNLAVGDRFSFGDASAAPTAEAPHLEIVPSATVWDGRYANNGWLQELPDPITKLTWGNAACVGPATWRAMGLERGKHKHDAPVVTLTANGVKHEFPVMAVPGQAEGTIVVSTGFGRGHVEHAAHGAAAGGGHDDGHGGMSPSMWGRVARLAHGGNAFALAGGGAFSERLSVRNTGLRQEVASTQDHGSMRSPDRIGIEGRVRPMVLEASLDHYREHPEFAQHAVEHPPLKQLFGDFEYDGYRWAMTIDLNACTGCNACVVACQAENNIPVVGPEQVKLGREMHWLRIDRYYTSPAADPEAVSDAQMVVQPVPCMHCENAPCEQVCPVAATVHDDEGLNVMVYNRCIGTRYCSNNCPYKVRKFNFFNYTKDLPQITRLAMNPDVTVRSRGVMEKCSYCTQRIQAARVEARHDGGRRIAEGEVVTACQQACPAGAIVFGDLSDDGSAVVAEKANPRNYAVLEELNVRPRTTYLAKLRNPNPAIPVPEPAHAAPAAPAKPDAHGTEGAHHG